MLLAFAREQIATPKACAADLSALLPRNPGFIDDQQELQLQVLKAHKQGSDKLHSKESLLVSRDGFWRLEYGLVIANGQNLKKQLACFTQLPIHGSLGCPQKAHDQVYWWEGIHQGMTQHIRHCSVCATRLTAITDQLSCFSD